MPIGFGDFLFQAQQAQIPSLLGTMGVINTVAAFAYSSALNRISGVRYRRLAALALFASWFATLMLVIAYVLESATATKGTGGILVNAGLVLWILSFSVVLVCIYLASRTAVGRGRGRAERVDAFEPCEAWPDFGVPAIDHAIERAAAYGNRVHYPFLLLHDIDSPGLAVVRRFVLAGLRAGEDIVYLSFSRPHGTIRRGIDRIEAATSGRIIVLDCYSRTYIPELVADAPADVLFADPRDPDDVYRKYMIALARLRESQLAARTVYETLSDFIKISDPDLVMHYLRRVVVLEEMRHVRAL